MITIFAWAVFLPSFIILMCVLALLAKDFFQSNWYQFKRVDNWVHLSVLILLTFVPGLYLFGW